MKKFLIILFLILSLKAYSAVYYVSTTGNDNADGAIGTPWATWQKAFNTAMPGDTVYFRGGVWKPTTKADANPYTSGTCLIDPSNSHGNSGTTTNWIYYLAYPGETPILDCEKMSGDAANMNIGLQINAAQFIKFKGLTIRNVYQKVFPVQAWGISTTYAANFIFENITIYNISGRAYWIQSGAYESWQEGAPCAYDSTYYINCDSYNLCDSIDYTGGDTPGNSADAWKCIYYKDNYAEWNGCRAWNYSDDGWDANNINGADLRMNNCWAMSSTKYMATLGDMEGNGFKSSGSYSPVTGNHGIFVNCLALFNAADGFTGNLEMAQSGNDYKPHYYNCTSYGSLGSAFSVINVGGVPRGSKFRNNIAYGNGVGYLLVRMNYPSIYVETNNTWDATQTSGAGSYPGYEISDTVTVTSADFAIVDSLSIVTLFTAARQSDGSLPVDKPLQLAATSDLIDMGIQVPASDNVDITISYSGSAPDIGYSEYSISESVAPYVSTNIPLTKNINTATGKGTVTNDGGETVIDRGVCWSTSSSPEITDSHVHASGTTGAFTVTITGLQSNTTYYIRAFATNSIGTSYGAQESIKTPRWSVVGGSSVTYVDANGNLIIIE